MSQPAAYENTRRFNTAQIYRFNDAPSRQEARRRVARLIAAVNRYPTAATEIVVGIGSRHLRGLIDDDLTENVVPFAPGKMRPTRGDVLVQVTSDTETGRLYGLRLAAAYLKKARLKTELSGTTRLGAREAFGYHDGDYSDHIVERPPAERVTSAEYPISFALYQRFVQDVDTFFDLHPQRQDEVIGRDREGGEVPADDSHMAIARQQGEGALSPLLRRGFRYRRDGEEGLVFIGLASSTRSLETALTNMLGTTGEGEDRLLEHSEATEGGVYAIVQDLDWLVPGGIPDPTPLPPAVQDLRTEAPFFLYEITVPTHTYMETLRLEMLELDPTTGEYHLTPDMASLIDALHWKLAGGEATVSTAGTPDMPRKDELDRQLREGFAAANRVNIEHGYYVTLNG